jgi:hypothetical protein
MANKIILKKSSQAGKIPTQSDLDYGELALNYTDGRIYYKNASNDIVQFSGGGGSGTLRVFQRGDTSPSEAVSVATTSGQLNIVLHDGSSTVGVFV